MAARSRNGSIQRACTLATDLKASNHIDLLPPWLAWCTPRGARTRTIPSHTFTHTHTHTTVRLSNVSSHVHGKKRCCCCRLCHRPFPPCIPLAFCFQANLNFVFTAKKNYAHQTHCLCAKNPHRFFSNTPSRLCPVEMVLRSTMQYILYKTDFYIIVLD